MQPENAIEVRNLTKKFKVYMDKGNQLKERMLFWKRNRYENRWVLNGISFSVRKGEAIGLVGHNGCGKSTTLKLLTKIIYPDSGTIEMCGRVSSLIELGAGFHPDMSGRENIYTNASIFGLSKKEIDARVDEIIAFSELEEFIDNPVRTYSSGMYMRLAFSVAINVDADILLIDEILGVGDAHFQEKCFDKLQDIKKNGTTIVIVSHSLGQIEEICERSIWIDKGKIRMEGKPAEVHEKYLEYMGVRISTEKKEELIRQQEEQRRKEEQDREEAKKLETTGFSIKNIKFTCADGTIKELGCGENGTGLELDYVVENVCADAKISFRMMEEGWIKIMGTNVKTIPVSEFETEVKQSRLFRYLAGINGQDQNYLNQMLINNKCERVKDVILLHEGGIMYGPYIMVAPMQYRVCIDVEYEGDQKPVLAVTDEYGKVRVTEKELKNGYNTVEFYLKEAAEKLEFVLYNTIEADIIVKSILLV